MAERRSRSWPGIRHEAPRALGVDQQVALEDAVLPHQILAGSDLRVLLGPLARGRAARRLVQPASVRPDAAARNHRRHWPWGHPIRCPWHVCSPDARPYPSSRARIAFIWSISACCVLWMVRHSSWSSGSAKDVCSHISSAAAWCGIIDFTNCRSEMAA